MNVECIHSFLTKSYWNEGMTFATKDAHSLYEKIGFKRFSDENKNRFMIFKREI
jgi:hypothetical protein